MATQITVTTSATTGLFASDPIRAAALGIEYLGWETFASFTDRLAETGAPHIRWPGAIPVEDGIDTNGDAVRDPVFDLMAPDLVTGWTRTNGTPREGLSDMLTLADQAGASLAVILPTARYVADGLAGSDGVARARAEIRHFLEALAAGAYGPVPDDLVLEIGTEYYATGVWKANLGTPDLARRFGDIFAAMADEAAAVRAETGLKATIAVQTARFQSADDTGNADGQYSDNLAFAEAFEAIGAGNAIDALIWHRYIPTYDRIGLYVDRIPPDGYADPQTAWLDTTLDLWAGVAGKPLDLVGGWLSPATRQGSSLEYGAPGLGNILQHFASMLTAGMDWGTIFGFAADRPGSLGRAGDLFLGGQLYQMMVESLPGTRVVAGFEDNPGPVLGTAWAATDAVAHWVFEDDAKLVIFVHARDFAGDSLDVTLRLDQAHGHAWAQHLLDPDGVDIPTADQIGTTGIVTRSVPVAADGTLTVTLTEDFELVRLIVAKAAPGAAPLHLWGGPGDESLTAGAGDDWLQGNAGDDVLAAGAGANTVDGGAGVDVLRLDAGRGAYDITVDGAVTVTGTGETTVATGVEIFDFAGTRIAAADLLASPLPLIAGTPGGDRLTGTAADERLSGGAGDDKLFGAGGGDELVDGTGRDNLFGQAGADTFVLVHDGQADAIKDFRVAEGDRIDLSAWGVTAPGDLTVTLSTSGKTVIRAGSEVLSIDTGTSTIPTAIADGSALILAPAPTGPVDIAGTGGDDKLFGSALDEILMDGAGRDNLFGRGGADIFRLSADGDADAIKDFQPGLDLIDLAAWNVAYDDLSITQHRTGKLTVRTGPEVLSVNDGSFTLTLTDLGPDAFVF